MTKGHFDALAEALARQQPIADGTRSQELYREQWRADVEAITQLCHEMSNFTPNGNRAFDRERFLQACGVEKP